MRRCFYDDYREYVDETVALFTDPSAMKRKGQELGIDVLRMTAGVPDEVLYAPREPPPGLLHLQRALRQMNPYILTAPVMDLVLEMTNKAASIPVPYVPFSKMPFWAEFDSFTIGSDLDQFLTILAYEDFVHPGRIRVQLMSAAFQVKELFFDQGTGAWTFEQIGMCKNTGPCPLSPKTIEGAYFLIDEGCAGQLMAEECACAQAGFYLTQTIRLLNHVLGQQHPITQVEQDRSVALPHKNATSARKKTENSRVASQNKRYPRYVEVSLSAPISVSQSAPRSRQELETHNNEDYLTIELEKIPVQSYWKVLIPGAGKPWRSMHLFHVESHKRSQKLSDVRTRYVIKE